MRYLLIIIAITLSGHLYAQQQVNVVLKSGKIITGKLVTSLYEDFITIEYSELNRENIPIDKISSIHFSPLQVKNSVEISEATYFKRTEGFFHNIDFQLLLGKDSDGYGYTNISLHTVNGYTFNSYARLGLGAGLDKYGDYLITPLYMSISGLIMERKISPFYYLNTGWGFMWKPEDEQNWIDYQDAKGGLHFQAGLGYQVNMKESALTFSVGYRLQKTHLKYVIEGWDWGGQTETSIDEERLLRRLALSLGFTF